MGEYMRNTPINVNGVRNNNDNKWIKTLRKITEEAWLIYPNWTEVRPLKYELEPKHESNLRRIQMLQLFQRLNYLIENIKS